MARFSRLTQFSSVAVLCFIMASAGYMMYLVYCQYQIREKLQKSSLERYLQEDEKKALAIGYFFTERFYDLSTLAESRELSHYYENQALGMSVTYGLGASIDAVAEQLRLFREKRTLDGRPIYARIAYAEASGRVLFDSTGKEISGRLRFPPLRGRTAGVHHHGFTYEKTGRDEYIVISLPFRFKGANTGVIAGWIPVELIYKHFVESTRADTAQLGFLMFPDRYLLGARQIQRFLASSSLPDPSGLKPGSERIFTVHPRGGPPQSIHAFVTSINNTPLALATLYRSGLEGAAPSPQRLFFILGGIALALLTGGIAFYRVSMRSMALEVRLDETRLREELVLQNNNSLRKLLAALEQSSNSVVITDASGCIEYVNPHFCGVSGYDAAEVMGKNPGFLKSGKEPPEKYRELWDTVLAGKSWSGEFLNRKKNGELYWEQTNIAPVIDDNGHISGFIAIKEDISQRKQAELELRSAKDAAEAASRTKSAFLANVSHEIRTPMNGIIGMTELCLSTNLHDQQRLYLTSVRESAETLLAIINDILDFSKIEAGKVELEKSPFLLRTSVGQALRTLAPRAAERGLEIIFNPSPGTPEALIGDPGRLKQVIVNLVGNSVKFSENGQVFVNVSVDSEDVEECLLAFSVQDWGIGIPPARQLTIFEPFEQGDLSTTKSYGGTGLGLTISKNLVELMGGTIRVQSVVGKGSTFSFTCRFRLNSSPERPFPVVDLHGLRALIVDDNAVNRRVLADFLTQWGIVAFQVEAAAQARTFLRNAAAESLPVDFLLVDLHMPVCDGWQFVEEIRSEPAYEHVRCILMPSVGTSGDSRRCSELGIDGYLAKPIVHSELHELLCMLASPAGSPRQAGRPPVTRHTVRENRSRLSILAAEDVPVNREIIQAILIRHGHAVTLVENGAEAVASWEQNNGGYDLILMDVQMPLMDGLQATRKIRELEKSGGSHVPIVAMTAYAMKGDRQRCLEAGMDDYISKPFRSEDIVQMLECYGTGCAPLASRAGMPFPAGTSGPVEKKCQALIFDRAGLLARIGGQEDLVDTFVGMFVSLVEKSLPRFETAVTEKDGERVRGELHAMKGAAANIGADRMLSLLAELQAGTKTGDLEKIVDAAPTLRQEFEQFKTSTMTTTDGR